VYLSKNMVPIRFASLRGMENTSRGNRGALASLGLFAKKGLAGQVGLGRGPWICFQLCSVCFLLLYLSYFNDTCRLLIRLLSVLMRSILAEMDLAQISCFAVCCLLSLFYRTSAD